MASSHFLNLEVKKYDEKKRKKKINLHLGKKRVFPQKMKYLMLGMMSLSLILMSVGSVPLRGVIYTGVFMALVAVWAWRYPSTPEEYDRRKAAGEKIAWLK